MGEDDPGREYASGGDTCRGGGIPALGVLTVILKKVQRWKEGSK